MQTYAGNDKKRIASQVIEIAILIERHGEIIF
jgi:hypothetical protein